ncbi:MAG TPA: hypothetical protein VLW50_25045 [Streptosporangiaceae bacterium]|nr:hypothetical protein [Streptosporangiaceae bacterium]
MTGLMPIEQVTDLVTARMDGPLADQEDVHGDEDTAAAAWLVAEAVRYLNDATGTLSAPGLTVPFTAYAVAGGLAVAMSRLGQLAGQLAGWLSRELAAGQLGENSGDEPAITVGRARRHLELAADAARLLERAMGEARDDMAGLCRPSADLPAGLSPEDQDR